MSADPIDLELADLTRQVTRERAFACPTGLHDLCTPAANHQPVVHDGLSG